MKTRISAFNILDVLFILSYSVGYASLLKFVTYAIFPIPESVQLFLFLSVIYIIRFKGRAIKRHNNSSLILVLFALYFWEIFQGVITGADINGILVVLVNLLSTYVAYKYMSNIIYTQLSIEPIIKSYSTYMYYTLFVVIISSVLILTSIMPPYTNLLRNNSLIQTNMETMENAAYYFPGYLSIVYSTPSIFLSRFNFPSLSGLSHESQAMYFTIYPAVFLLFSKKGRNVERNVLLIFVLTTVLTTSLTAAICFILTYCFHLFWKLNDKSQFRSALITLGVLGFVGYWIVQSQFGTIINAYILEKANFDTVGSSGSYSLSLMSYIFSPTSLIGHGIFSSTSEQAMQLSSNCGYISSFMIILFYLFFIYTSLKNIFSDKLVCHAIGLASFYFIAHSFKYGIQLFNNTYIFFIVFVLVYAESIRVGKEDAFYYETNGERQKGSVIMQ